MGWPADRLGGSFPGRVGHVSRVGRVGPVGRVGLVGDGGGVGGVGGVRRVGRIGRVGRVCRDGCVGRVRRAGRFGRDGLVVLVMLFAFRTGAGVPDSSPAQVPDSPLPGSRLALWGSQLHRREFPTRPFTGFLTRPSPDPAVGKLGRFEPHQK